MESLTGIGVAGHNMMLLDQLNYVGGQEGEGEWEGGGGEEAILLKSNDPTTLRRDVSSAVYHIIRC